VTKQRNPRLRRAIATILTTLLVWLSVSAASAQPTAQQSSLVELINKSYLELLQLSPSLNFSQQEIDDFKEHL